MTSTRAGPRTWPRAGPGRARGERPGPAGLGCASRRCPARGGPLGTGTVVKLVTNQIWFINAAAIGEALVLGKKAGVELTVLWDALKNSVGDTFVVRHDVPSIFAGHYDPSFTLDLCCKDLGLIAALSQTTQTPAPMTAQAK